MSKHNMKKIELLILKTKRDRMPAPHLQLIMPVQLSWNPLYFAYQCTSPTSKLFQLFHVQSLKKHKRFFTTIFGRFLYTNSYVLFFVVVLQSSCLKRAAQTSRVIIMKPHLRSDCDCHNALDRETLDLISNLTHDTSSQSSSIKGELRDEISQLFWQACKKQSQLNVQY